MDERIKLNEQNLDAHIADAYIYAKKHFKKFVPSTVRNGKMTSAPIEDGTVDRFSLVVRALYTMGYLPEDYDGDLVNLLEYLGFERTEDTSAIFKGHGIVCLKRSDAPADYDGVDYIYYSLGGEDICSIDKYDIGTPLRLTCHKQPYKLVDADEWRGKLSFVCLYYVPKSVTDKRLRGRTLFRCTTKRKISMKSEPGRYAPIMHTIGKGVSRLRIYAFVTTGYNISWCYAEHNGFFGWIYRDYLKCRRLYISPQEFRASSPDGKLERMMGPGRQYKFVEGLSPARNGEKFRVITVMRGDDGILWANVKDKRDLCYFVQRRYLKEMGEDD